MSDTRWWMTAAGAAAAGAAVVGGLVLWSRRQGGMTFLDSAPDTGAPVTLLARTQLTHNVVELVFALPEEDAELGLGLGQHVGVVLADEASPGGVIKRSYTPVSRLDTAGSFTLIVKVYEGGRVSGWLGQLEPGDAVTVRGPVGRWVYPGGIESLVLIAGGSGITPVLQLATELLDAPSPSSITLIYANSTPEDVILYDHLVDLAAKYPETLELHLYVSRVEPDSSSEWAHQVGRLDAAVLGRILPPASTPDLLVAYCGPSGFNKTVSGVLKDSGFTRDQIHRF